VRSRLPSQATVTNRQAVLPILLFLTASLSLIGAGGLIIWHRYESPPRLVDIRALGRGHQFEQAQELLERYLRTFPEDNRARMLMAQICMDRRKPQPAIALHYLERVQTSSRQEAALLQFSEGRAHYQLKRYDLSEACWKEALALDPVVPEAGWALLDLLDLEGRVEEAHQLAMRLYETEPDPRDRVRLLLEMIRLDVEKVAPGSVVQVFESAWKAHPESLNLALVLGSALIHDSQPAKGIEVLQDGLRRNPDSAEAWDGWLSGLDDGHEPELLRQEFERLPGKFKANPRFAKYEGIVAQDLHDWPRAVAAYRHAYEFERYNGVVLYRLRMVLRAVGQTAEVNRIESLLTEYQTAFKELRPVYLEVKKIKTLGLRPHTDIYQRLADLREKMGRFDESRAWHHLVLEFAPTNLLSLAALERLK
jgi:tetratricopeptide (TPR) repeat protein